MAYIHTHKPDIFISYAHVDDEPDPAFPDRPGWVTTLVRCLEKRIAKKLGRVDSYDIWRDPKLAGHVDLSPDIIGRVRDAAVFLLVLSPAYLMSEWCRRELRVFDEAIRGRKAARGRIFVVEFDRVGSEAEVPRAGQSQGISLLGCGPRHWESRDPRLPDRARKGRGVPQAG